MSSREQTAQAMDRCFPSTRVLRLVRQAIDRYQLDLEGLTVLTEAATGYYRITPIIATLGRASHVIAVARDGPYGPAERALDQVRDLAAQTGQFGGLELSTEPARSFASMAQLITNLGAVRPIDEDFVAKMSGDSAVSLMFGADDARPADLSVTALRQAEIPICGVDEERIDLFRWTGLRIAWWLCEVGLELVGAKILVWGHSPQARRAAQWLADAGAETRLHEDSSPPKEEPLTAIDAIVLMDRTAAIGPSAKLRPETLAELAPGSVVLEYAGLADRSTCDAAGLIVYPREPPRLGHVGRTIGEILYAPIVELHTAGLRVGELMVRARRAGLEAKACELIACQKGPGEPIPWP